MGTYEFKKLMIVKIIYSLNPLYVIANTGDRHTDQKNENKYLAFDSTSKELLDNFPKLWNEIKYLIKTINGGKESVYLF